MSVKSFDFCQSLYRVPLKLIRWGGEYLTWIVWFIAGSSSLCIAWIGSFVVNLSFNGLAWAVLEIRTSFYFYLKACCRELLFILTTSLILSFLCSNTFILSFTLSRISQNLSSSIGPSFHYESMFLTSLWMNT